jgi:hypothetical protein
VGHGPSLHLPQFARTTDARQPADYQVRVGPVRRQAAVAGGAKGIVGGTREGRQDDKSEGAENGKAGESNDVVEAKNRKNSLTDHCRALPCQSGVAPGLSVCGANSNIQPLDCNPYPAR